MKLKVDFCETDSLIKTEFHNYQEVDKRNSKTSELINDGENGTSKFIEKEYVDNCLSEKADVAQVDAKFLEKANVTDIFTKEQTRNLLNQKTSTSDFNEAVRSFNIITNNLIIDKQNKLTAGHKISLDNNVISLNNSWTLYDEIEITQDMVDEAGEEGITSIILGDEVTPLPNWASEFFLQMTIPDTQNIPTNKDKYPVIVFGSIGYGYDGDIYVKQGGWGENYKLTHCRYGLHVNFITRQSLISFAPYNTAGYAYPVSGTVLSENFNMSFTNKLYISSIGSIKFKFPVGTKMKAMYR